MKGKELNPVKSILTAFLSGVAYKAGGDIYEAVKSRVSKDKKKK